MSDSSPTPPVGQTTPSQRTGWMHFLHFLASAGGAALITAVIVGLFGTLITIVAQYNMKSLDFQRSRLKARGDQALLAYKDYLDGERKIAERVYGEVGKTVSAIESLHSLTQPEFNPAPYHGKALNELTAQRSRIRREFNSAAAAWRTNRNSLGFLVGYYHHRSPEINRRWRDVQRAVDSLGSCAEKWYLRHIGQYSRANPCVEEHKRVEESLRLLEDESESVRRYAWEDWEPSNKPEQTLRQDRERQP